jgi:hypothetical protein
MENSRMPKRVMREKIYTKRRRGRPKVRWLDDVQDDLRERDLWRRIAQEARAHEGLQGQVVVVVVVCVCVLSNRVVFILCELCN